MKNSLISSLHVHGHLISTPQEVKFCVMNKSKNTYTEVAWYEETTSVIFRKKVFSVRKYGVLESFKLAMDFRNMLIGVKEERMKLFVDKVKKEIVKEMTEIKESKELNCKA